MQEIDMKRQRADHAEKRFRRYPPIIYGYVLAAMLLLLVLNVAMKSKPGAYYGLDGFVALNDGWQTEDGSVFRISEIDKLSPNSSGEIWLYHKLPDSLDGDTSLVFRTKNCLVDVRVGEKQAYNTDITEAPFYNHSPGTRWNVVTVSDDEAGETVRIAVKQAYRDGRAKVDNFFFGDRAAILLHIVESKSEGFVISLLILFVGVIFLLVWLILNWRRRPKNNSLLWLAAFAFAGRGLVFAGDEFFSVIFP